MSTTTTVKERPILFSGAMVRALLAGTKTQTRRIVKPQLVMHDFGIGGVHPAFMPPKITKGFLAVGLATMLADNFAYLRTVPYGIAGDRLWVRETWHPNGVLPLADRPLGDFIYRADLENGVSKYGAQWKPSIFMPRQACRLMLEVTDVRVERLHAIGKDGRGAKDVLAEGITPEQIAHQAKFFHADDSPALAYAALWESINGAGSWKNNPWVWVISFRRVEL